MAAPARLTSAAATVMMRREQRIALHLLSESKSQSPRPRSHSAVPSRDPGRHEREGEHADGGPAAGQVETAPVVWAGARSRSVASWGASTTTTLKGPDRARPPGLC